MKSAQNILVPIDFSDESIEGLKAACGFAQKTNAKIHLAHFLLSNVELAPLHPKEAVLGIKDNLHQKDLERKRQEAYEKLKAMMKSLVPETLQGHDIVAGSTLEETFERCLNDFHLKIDLVITGNYGSSGIMEFFIGNKIDKMIRKSDIPVLVVNKEDDLMELSNILILTDLSNEIPDEIYEMARSFKADGAKLHFINIITTELIEINEVEKMLKTLMNRQGLEGSNMVVRKNSDEKTAILELSDKLDADLILMKTYEKSAFMAFAAGSLAESLTHATDIPIAVEKVSDSGLF